MTSNFVKQCHLSRENTVLQFVLRQYGQALSNISPPSVQGEHEDKHFFCWKIGKIRKGRKETKKEKEWKERKHYT
jgi:hypothetical protein